MRIFLLVMFLCVSKAHKSAALKYDYFTHGQESGQRQCSMLARSRYLQFAQKSSTVLCTVTNAATPSA